MTLPPDPATRGGGAAKDRRARAAAVRAAQQRQERRRRLGVIAAVVIALFALGGATALVLAKRGPAAPPASRQILPSTPPGTRTLQRLPNRVADTSGIPGALAWDIGRGPVDAAHPAITVGVHVAGPVTYAITPPVGGPHNAVWMNAGAYTRAVPGERAVHNLEHGAVWITYTPDLPTKDVTALTALVTKQSLLPEASPPGQANRYIDLSPWPSDTLPAPIVISSWGHQLRVTSPADPRLQRFIDTFRHSKRYSPEFGSPVDGVPLNTGGRPATDGSSKAAPAGS